MKYQNDFESKENINLQEIRVMIGSLLYYKLFSQTLHMSVLWIQRRISYHDVVYAPLQVACVQVIASPTSYMLPRKIVQASLSEENLKRILQNFHNPTHYTVIYMICLLSLVGYFDLTLVIKLVPNKLL